jgi:hypothetical protein
MRREVPDKCFAFSGMREASTFAKVSADKKASLTDLAMLLDLALF